MAAIGWLLIVIGMIAALAPTLYMAVAGPDMTRLEFARHYWPVTVPAVAAVVVGVALVRRSGR